MEQFPPFGDFGSYLEYQLFRDRTLLLSGEVDESVASTLTLLFQLLANEPTPITLLITSYGGAVDAGNAIIRAMRYAQGKGCQVVGEIRAYGMSMAALILQATDLRLASVDDLLMVHGVSGASVGDIRDAEADLAMTKRLRDIQASFLAARNTSDDPKYHNEGYWRGILDDAFPRYLFGNEALAQGLLDGLID